MQLQDYLNRITSEHNQRPNFVALLSIFAQGQVDNQTILDSLIENFDLPTAVGQALDYIGTWVGLSRNGLSDTVYRILLQAQIALNHWNGNVPGMYTIWGTAFEGNVSALVQDNQDMSMFVVFVHFFDALAISDPTSWAIIVTLLLGGNFALRPAGVLLLGYYVPSVPGIPVFGFDAENSSVSGFDVGAWVIPMVA